jgi:hypothetical protein
MLTESQARLIIERIPWPDGARPLVAMALINGESHVCISRGSIEAKARGVSPEACLSLALSVYVKRASLKVELPQLSN